MKKRIPFLTALLTTLCFILFTNGLMYAQKYTYKLLALEGAHWWVELNDDNFPLEPPDHYQYVVRGDSVLNEITYKKVYYRDLTDQNPHLIEYEILSRLVRDDTLNKKVYAIYLDFPQWNCPENEDILLYDYDLNVGDSMNTCLTNWTGPNIIQSIGYEFIYGEERKVINSGENGIEGIGSNYGVFEWGFGSKERGLNDRGWGFSLFDYCLGTDEECGCQWVDIEERKETPAFRVYPNPIIGNTITLVPHTPITQPMDVKLYDNTGREVYQQHFGTLTQEVTIQIPAHLSSGTSPMLLWIGNSRQVFFKQLLIKQ
jgi:hypothetical protein